MNASPQHLIDQLHAQGYAKAYEWESAFGEVDPDHAHDFETKMVILAGEMAVTFDGQTHLLKPGDELVVPANTTHSAKAGDAGCLYVIGEKIV